MEDKLRKKPPADCFHEIKHFTFFDHDTLRSIINKKYLLKAQSPIHVPNDAFLCIE